MNFLKILTKYLSISIITGLFFVSSLVAQEQKIGVVNFQALVESSPQFREVMQSLAGEFQPRQRDRSCEANTVIKCGRSNYLSNRSPQLGPYPGNLPSSKKVLNGSLLVC